MRLDIRNMGLLVNEKNERLLKAASDIINEELLEMLYNQDYEVYIKKDDASIIFIAFLVKSSTSAAPVFLKVDSSLNGEFSDFFSVSICASVKNLCRFDFTNTDMNLTLWVVKEEVIVE